MSWEELQSRKLVLWASREQPNRTLKEKENRETLMLDFGWRDINDDEADF